MTQKKIWKWSTCLFALGAFSIQMLHSPVVQAAEEGETQTEEKVEKENSKESSLADQTGFTVESIQPDTQINKDYSFFYIRVAPGEKQTLQVKVSSKRKEPSKVKIFVNNAVTNTMGQIDYGQSNVVLDKSLTIPLTDFVRPKEKEITVQNFEEKIVELAVEPSEAHFSGVRLGAVVFQSADKKKDASGVESTYGYKIGILTSEELKPYNEGATLKYEKVKARLQNGEKVVATTVQNPEPFVLENLTMKSELRRKGEKKAVASQHLTGMKIAPNSSFDFLTYLGIDQLKSGRYQIEMKASDGSQQWNWVKEFEITDKQANQMNKEAAYQLTLPKLYKVGGVILLLLTVTNLAYLIYRKRRSRLTNG